MSVPNIDNSKLTISTLLGIFLLTPRSVIFDWYSVLQSCIDAPYLMKQAAAILLSYFSKK